MFELVTGTVMERLFKVKYWDYSELPLNYNGHICLFVSLFWGFFSVLLVQIIHVPAENFLFKVPQFLAEIIAFSLMALFVYDASASFNEAMDLRELLESLSENNETLNRLERRFDALVAFTPIPDMDDLREIKMNAKENIVYNIEKLRWNNEQRLNRIKEYIQLAEFEKMPERRELLKKIEFHRKNIAEKSNKQYLRAVKQLKRNPDVSSQKYHETLETLKELLRSRD